MFSTTVDTESSTREIFLNVSTQSTHFKSHSKWEHAHIYPKRLFSPLNSPPPSPSVIPSVFNTGGLEIAKYCRDAGRKAPDVCQEPGWS